MIDLTGVSVISTAENALNRLKKAEIAVYDCKKEGAKFIFFVKDKDIKKVFAIFNKPCYNIKVIRKSKLKRALSFLALRAGLIVGGVLFCVLAIISNAFILKIEVSGSGSYLEPEVLRIVSDEGAKKFGRYSQFNACAATGKILALPQVTFCNVKKTGSVLVVDVQVDAENFSAVKCQPLISDVDGIVKNIVAICGTAEVCAGDSVRRGDTLIGAYSLNGETRIDCLAVGYAEIERRCTFEYFVERDCEESLKEAYSAFLLESESVLEKNFTVKPTDGGVIYVIDCVFLHKISINLT